MANGTMVGALRIEATLESGKFVDGAKKIRSETQKTEATVKKSFGGMSSSVGSSMGALKASALGFASAISIGLFTKVIGNALKYASSLKDVSEQLGVTTRDLQTLRYAAQQSGVGQQQLDDGLEKLTLTLGRVAAGAKEPIKALEAIGVTAAQLKGKDTGEAFRIIADALSKVGDRAQRAAVEVALFQENGAKLDAVLMRGSQGINELAMAAEDLGIVLSEDEIANADATAKKLESIKTVLEARIAGVVAENADAILQLADALTQIVNVASRVINAVARIGQAISNIPPPPAWMSGPLGAALGFVQAVNAQRNQLGSSVTVKLPPARKAAGTGTIKPFLASGGGGGGRKRSGRAPRDTSLRDAFQFDQDLLRAQMDVLRATKDLSTDYIERGNIAIQILDLEKQGYEAELKFQVATGELSKAQAQQLQLEYDKKDALERQSVLADREAQRAEDSARLDNVSFELERDRLESEAQLKETAQEQREVQLRLLDLLYRQEEARLDAVLADESSSETAKEEARRRKAGLKDTYANDRQAVVNNTRGPLESYMATLPTTAEKWNEALQEVAVDGLKSIEDGLLDILDGTKSVTEAFRDMARDILRDLLKLAIRKFITAPLANALFGGFSEGGSIPVASVPGFATGGSMMLGGRTGFDKNMLSLNGLPIARVTRGEMLHIVPANDQGRGGMSVVNNWHLTGNPSRETLAQIQSKTRRGIADAARKGFS